MLRKVLAGTALSGLLALGTVTAASAATTSGPGASGGGNKAANKAHFCSVRAPKVLARIQKYDTAYPGRLQKAEARLQAAQQQGNTTLAQKIQAHIQKAEARHTKVASLQQKIETACPGATAGSSSGSSGSTTTT
ncbi:MAG TPA: hypothetical protein VK277_04670 [Acidimicrobiales bacterium]|nr:hypothetical protein [Acidimicrobiales bacterium]